MSCSYKKFENFRVLGLIERYISYKRQRQGRSKMLGFARSTTPFTTLRQGRGFSPTSMESLSPCSSSPMNSWNQELLLPRCRSPLNKNSREFCSAFLRPGFFGEMPTSSTLADDFDDQNGMATALRNIDIVKRPALYCDTVREDFQNNGVDAGEVANPFTPERCSTPLLRQRNDNDVWGPFYGTTKPLSYCQPPVVQSSQMVNLPPLGEMQNFTDFKDFAAPQQKPAYNKKKYNKVKDQAERAPDHCAFCHNNGEHEALVRSHNVRDAKGRTLCPKLRIYACEICGKDGDEAHTIKYCKQKRIITQEDTEKWSFKRKRLGCRPKYNAQKMHREFEDFPLLSKNPAEYLEF